MSEKETKESTAQPGEGEPGSQQVTATPVESQLAELKQAMVEKDGRIAELESRGATLEKELGEVMASLTEAVNGYRVVVTQANPDIMSELIAGENIQAINDSLARAKALVSKVRQGLEAEVARNRVPAGAPPRMAADASALSPREKIQMAIGNLQTGKKQQ